MNQELERRLSSINEKEQQIKQLQYETYLIKNDCVNVYRDRRCAEISELTDIHAAWCDQPKKITHKIYKMKYLKNKYHWFMYWIQSKIFDDIIYDVKFNGKLVLIGYGSVAIRVPFKYKGVDFAVQIPNIGAIHEFKDIMDYGFYELSRKPSENVSITFARFYDCEELKEKIKEVLDKEIKEVLDKEIKDEPKERKCDLKTAC